MRREDLEHLQQLAMVKLKPEERDRLLRDLQAMVELAARLKIDSGDLAAPNSGADLFDRPYEPPPVAECNRDQVRANCPGWSPPFFTVPSVDPRKDTEGS